jgi:hypothetical protein
LAMMASFRFWDNDGEQKKGPVAAPPSGEDRPGPNRYFPL